MLGLGINRNRVQTVDRVKIIPNCKGHQKRLTEMDMTGAPYHWCG